MEQESGTLFVVATPIGNLEDISSRAIRTLKEVDLIIAERPQHSRRIMQHFDIHTDILIYNQHSSIEHSERILSLLRSGKNIALITDAGTPGISDPGNELVSFLTSNGANIKVSPIPGPSSLIAALSVCGFDVSHFTFIGFFPKKKQLKLIKQISESDCPVAFFDSPMRIQKNLKRISEELPTWNAFVGRELTKIYEQVYRGNITEVLGLLQKQPVKGECVVILSRPRKITT